MSGAFTSVWLGKTMAPAVGAILKICEFAELDTNRDPSGSMATPLGRAKKVPVAPRVCPVVSQRGLAAARYGVDPIRCGVDLAHDAVARVRDVQVAGRVQRDPQRAAQLRRRRLAAVARCNQPSHCLQPW